MARVQGDELIVDPQGHLLERVDGATIWIYLPDGVTPATIYADSTSGATITQPLTTTRGLITALGGADWWIDPGLYIRAATHPDGRVLARRQLDYPSGVDSATLADHEARFLLLPLNGRHAPYSMDPTGAVSAQTGLDALIADSVAQKRPAYIPTGRYKAKLLPGSDASVWGDGPGLTIIDASTVSADSDGRYRGAYAKGTVGAAILLARDAYRGEMQVDIADASSLSPGDQVDLRTAGPRGTLDATINASVTSIVLTKTTGSAPWPAKGWALCGTERIGYDGAADNTPSAGKVTLSARAGSLGRGSQNTAGMGGVAASHNAGVAIYAMDDALFDISGGQCFERGEAKWIDRIVGNTLIFETPVLYDHPIRNLAQVRKVTPKANIEIAELSVEHPTAVTAHTEDGAWFERCDRLTIRNVRSENASENAIALANCTRSRIESAEGNGKATSDTGAHGFYFLALINGCHDIEVRGAHAKKYMKVLTTFANGVLSGSLNDYCGSPGFWTMQGFSLDNASVGFYSRHPGVEIHRAGRQYELSDGTITGADSLISVQAGGERGRISDIGGSGWHRAGVIFSELRSLRDFQMEGVQVGRRTFGVGRSTLAADPGSGGLTLTLASGASRFLDDPTTGAGLLAVITDADGVSNREVVRISASADDTHLTVPTGGRGQTGTSAVAHAIGSIISAYGNSAACPLDIDLSDCGWGRRVYGQPITALAADPGTGGTSLTTQDTSAQTDWPTVPFLAIIEGEDSTRNFEPEIVLVTAQTATTMTVTRAQEDTTPTAHTSGVFLMPYEPAVDQVTIDGFHADQELSYYGIAVRGYVPTRQFSIGAKTKIKYTGPQRHSTDGCIVYPHSVDIAADLSNFPNAFRAMGNGQAYDRSKARAPFQETIGGYGIRVEGYDVRIIKPRLRRLYQAIQIAAANLRTIIDSPIMEVPSASRGINGWDATTIVPGKPVFILPSGQDLAIAATATLTPASPGDLYWRVTGNTGITAHAVMADGTRTLYEFTGTPTLTPGATLKTNAGATLSMTADDVLELVHRNGVARQIAPQSVN